MTFPTIPTVAAGRALSSLQANTTATRTFPNLSSITKNPGDLLLAIILAYQGPPTGTDAAFSGWGAGFTECHDSATSGTMAIGIAYKWSDGTESGTFTVTQAGAALITGHAVMAVLSIPGAHPTTPPEVGGRASGTNTAATPGALNPADWDVEDALWLMVGGCGETSGTGSFTGIASGNPTNYTGAITTNITADAVGGLNASVAFRELAAASEDPPAFSNDTSNARWGAVTIAIRPAPAPADLMVADSAHGHTTDAVALTQVHSLAAADSAHGHSADAVVLTQVHELAVADSAHTHTTEGVTLSVTTSLVVADSDHAHATDALALTQVHSLTVDDSTHAHSTEAVGLTQAHTLAVADSVHAHTAEPLALVVDLVVADSLHAHTTESVTLGDTAVTLTVSDSDHAHTTELVTLTQVHALAVLNSLHSHTTDVLTLTTPVATPGERISAAQAVTRISAAGSTSRTSAAPRAPRTSSASTENRSS